MKRTVAVDFDGVIHKYSSGWQNGEIYDIPVEGSEQALKKLLKTYNVFIFTARDPRDIFDWLRNHFTSIKFKAVSKKVIFWTSNNIIGVTNRKLPALYYIDDRAVKFSNWEKALKEVNV